MLAEKCHTDLNRRLRGKNRPKAELLSEERSSFLPLPPSPFDACRKHPTRASSLSLVRFDDNDYSVPVAYAHHEILIKGYVNRVVLCHKEKIIAEHRRSWSKEGVLFNYLHYLPLLERKPGSFDHARPFADLYLPECFDILRRRLSTEEENKGDGLREFIKVLRLLEDYSMPKLRQAVQKGIRIRAHSRDAIAQFLVPRASWRQSTFLLDGHEHLRRVKVTRPTISAYRSLLGGTA